MNNNMWNSNICVQLAIIFLSLSSTSSLTTKQNITQSELIARSKFKDKVWKKEITTFDQDPQNQPYGYIYHFNMLGQVNKDTVSGKINVDEFFFNMYNYQRGFPTILKGSTMDYNFEEISTPKSVLIRNTMVTTVRLKPDFHKAEIKILKNNCLTLFTFLDTEEYTDVRVYEDKPDVYFNMKESRANNFNEAFYFFYRGFKNGHDVVYNEFNHKEDLFLKFVCPYYSAFGKDEIDLEISIITKNDQFNGKESCEI